MSGRYAAQLLRLGTCLFARSVLECSQLVAPDYQPVNGAPHSLALAEVRPAQEAHYTTRFVLPSQMFWQ
jgi:hypothetical protein